MKNLVFLAPDPQAQPLLGLLVRPLLECRGKRLRWDQNLPKLCPTWTAPGLRDPEGIAIPALDQRRPCCRDWDLEGGFEPGSQDRYDQEGWRYPKPGLDQGDLLSSQN